MKEKYLVCIVTQLLALGHLFGQDKISGNLQLNHNFFKRDTLIGASNTPQYDHQLSGTEGWLNLNYANWGFDMGLRLDFFQNSNLRNPLQSYSEQGIGLWYISKQAEKLGVSAGYLYDQIGSGIAFRAYEARPLAIDNALVGIRLTYDFTDNLHLKGFTGRQKNAFDLYAPIVKGASLDWYTTNDSMTLSIAPGLGVVNRTIDDASMQRIVSDIATYSPVDSFAPKFNTYVFAAYNTLTFKNFAWYVEGAFKTHEAIALPDGKLVDRGGSVLFSSLAYSQSGFAVALQGKRTENFSLRTSPNETLLRGMLNFIPPMARQNTYRLTARYNAATQMLGEWAWQADASYRVNKALSLSANFANITDLDNELLYRELFTEASFKYKRLWRLVGGVQWQQYNQEVYEQKVDVPMVRTFVPYLDATYQMSRKKSARMELQYMRTDQDLGSWMFGLLEFSIAPHWSFSLSDMVTLNPEQYYQKTNRSPENLKKKLHFYSALVAYTNGANRFQASYVRQVEGIVCTGGICRYEPAFSGVRLGVNSRF